MAEYIEREAVEEIMQKHICSDCTNEKSLDCPLCQLHRPFDEISKIPTADVVPKSEVEKLKQDLEIAEIAIENRNIELEGMRTAANSYKMHYEQAKAEVAREIFEEIESLLATYTYEDNYGDYISTGVTEELAELKKKYTEGGK